MTGKKERRGILELEKRQRSPLSSDFYREERFKSGNLRITAIGSPIFLGVTHYQ
ncbi:hypothetical protein HGO21_27750 [Acinetobacter sp. CUI P1]|nr:hypothetical protein [Acinetobacter sp. CUI P1]